MSDTQRDYYEVLGVSRTATADEIKHAYRLKVRDCHPDTHRDDPDAERKYKEVNEAFSVLGNAEKRAQYDQFGTQDPNINVGANPFGNGAEDIFGDLFGSMFGGGFGGTTRRANAPTRGADLQMAITISLMEAATGVTRKITIPRWEPCDHCHGTGAEPGHDIRQCPDCGGTGQVRRRVRTIFGETVTVTPCPTCGGRGQIIDKPCTECGGEGRLHRRREQEIKIQPGVDTGTRLRVPGAGELGTNGGTPGDLYIVIRVEDHPDFKRDGPDLHKTVTIPWPLAVLGGKSTVKPLCGDPVSYRVPEGTAPGATIRIAGKGMPRLRGTGNGDLYLHVTVQVPKASSLSPHASELIQQLAEELSTQSNGEKGSSGLFETLFGTKKGTTKKKSRKKK